MTQKLCDLLRLDGKLNLREVSEKQEISFGRCKGITVQSKIMNELVKEMVKFKVDVYDLQEIR